MIGEAGLGSQVGLLFRAKLIGPDDKSRLTSGRCVRRVQIAFMGSDKEQRITLNVPGFTKSLIALGVGFVVLIGLCRKD